MQRLLQGVSSGHLAKTRQAWRELLADKEAAIALVLERLASPVWTETPKPPGDRYFGVLLALLAELDAGVFRSEIGRLEAAEIHAAHRLTLNLLSKRAEDRMYGKIDGLIPVYISHEITEPAEVFNRIEKWSKTQDVAISSVARIDVIKERDEFDYLGLYDIQTDAIILTWYDEGERGLLRWLRRFNAERTFYHEVGHHFFQHSEGGQVEEQEKQADDYARQMLRNAHPRMFSSLSVVLFPLKALLRMVRFFRTSG